jgi:hypothetical protein
MDATNREIIKIMPSVRVMTGTLVGKNTLIIYVADVGINTFKLFL